MKQKQKTKTKRLLERNQWLTYYYVSNKNKKNKPYILMGFSLKSLKISVIYISYIWLGTPLLMTPNDDMLPWSME